MAEDERILLDFTLVETPEEPGVDYAPKQLSDYLPEGEQSLAMARRNELKQRNPQLTDETLEEILDWEIRHDIFTRFNYERPSYGVDESGNAYGIFFHGNKHSGVRAFPEGSNETPTDFDIVSHVNNIEGDSRAYSLTFSPAVATQWFGNVLEVFLVPIKELDNLHDPYMDAKKQGVDNRKTLGRLQSEKEFVMFGDPLKNWYEGSIEAQMERVAGIQQVDARSLGILRNPAGLILGDPNKFIEFVKKNGNSAKRDKGFDS